MDGGLKAQGLRAKAKGVRPKGEDADSELDRELESALRIEPSPEFLARTRMRVASEPVVESGFSQNVESAFSRIRPVSFEPLAAVAVVGIIVAIVVPGLMRDDAAAPRATVKRAAQPTPVARAPVARAAQTVVTTAHRTRAAAEGRPQSAARAAEEMHTLPLQLSPVLFAEEDRLAFAAFISAVNDGIVPEKVVQAPDEEDMTPLVIAPLIIEPLPALARVDRQGEGQW